MTEVSLCFTSAKAALARATNYAAREKMGKPIDHLATAGDLVILDVFEKQDTDLPGLVLQVEDNWAHVEWYDHSKAAKAWGESKWTQWHPCKSLSVISRG